MFSRMNTDAEVLQSNPLVSPKPWGHLYEIQRNHMDQWSRESISEIVHNLNAKVRKNETDDIIDCQRRSYEMEIPTVMSIYLTNLKDISPQFADDVNVALKTYKNNDYVELMLLHIVSELFLSTTRLLNYY